ncbi:MAG: hypothetical protein Q9185_001049, partial [Variospora sp. 1 TL-2023]
MPFTPTSSGPFAEQRQFVLSAASSDLHHSPALPVPQHEEDRASDHHRNVFYAHRRKVSRYASLFSAITADQAERSASAVTPPRSGPWNEPGESRPQIERIPPEGPQLLPAIGSEWKQKQQQQQQQRSENSSPGTNGEGNALVVLLPGSNRASDVIVAPPPPSGSNPPAS